MRRFGLHFGEPDPSQQARRRVLSAIGDGRLSGFEVALALAAADADSAGAPAGSSESAPAADVVSAGAPAGGDESFLYPTLHRLEADGDLQAAWASAGSDKSRRTYARRRRFRPFRFGTR